MQFAGTYWRSAGPTFFPSAEGHEPTAPDQYVVPAELSVANVTVLWKKGRKLQIMPHCRSCEHLPVLLTFRYEVIVSRFLAARGVQQRDPAWLSFEGSDTVLRLVTQWHNRQN